MNYDKVAQNYQSRTMVHINMKFKALQRREGGEIKTQDYMDCMQACYAEQACIIKILKTPSSVLWAC